MCLQLSSTGVTLGALASMIKIVEPPNKSKEWKMIPKCIRPLILEPTPASTHSRLPKSSQILNLGNLTYSLLATQKSQANNTIIT